MHFWRIVTTIVCKKALFQHDVVLQIAQDLFKNQWPQPQRAIQVQALLSQPFSGLQCLTNSDNLSVRLEAPGVAERCSWCVVRYYIHRTREQPYSEA